MRSFKIDSYGVAAIIAVCVAAPCNAQDVGFPAVEGWSAASEVRTYTADNLWEYINGAAELFVEYDIESCFTGDIAAGDLVATVDYYYMGTPLNAFGVYVRERPEPGSKIPGATEGLISPPYQALLLKGSMYVKANVYEGELTEEIGRSLLEAIAGALPGTTDYPVELGVLPTRGRVAGTSGFQREGLLGLSELTDCLYAEYAADGGGEPWQGFVMLPTAHESIESIWDRLAARWDSTEHNGQTVLHREIPYRGLVGVLQAGEYIIGASGASDEADLLQKLQSLDQ